MSTTRAGASSERKQSERVDFRAARVYNLRLNAPDFNAGHKPLRDFSLYSDLRSVFTGHGCLL